MAALARFTSPTSSRREKKICFNARSKHPLHVTCGTPIPPKKGRMRSRGVTRCGIAVVGVLFRNACTRRVPMGTTLSPWKSHRCTCSVKMPVRETHLQWCTASLWHTRTIPCMHRPLNDVRGPWSPGKGYVTYVNTVSKLANLVYLHLFTANFIHFRFYGRCDRWWPHAIAQPCVM